jgi:hypothetical protein
MIQEMAGRCLSLRLQKFLWIISNASVSDGANFNVGILLW